MLLTPALAFISAACCAVIALVALVRRFHQRIEGVLFLISISLVAIERILLGLSFHESLAERILLWHHWHLAIIPALSASWLGFSAVYSRDQPLRQLKDWGFGLAAILASASAFIFVSDRSIISQLHYAQSDDNWIVILGWGGVSLLILQIIGSVLTGVNLERTYRAAVGAVRWRIKYMVLGAGLLQLVYFYTSSQSVLFRFIGPNHCDIISVATIIAALAVAPALWRAGATDTPVYIGRKSLLSSLSFAIAGLYLLVIGFLAQVVSRLGGDATFALKAFLILLALVIAAAAWQSDRVRQFIAARINRHFQRPEFDYRGVWLRFIGSTSECVDAAELCRTAAQQTADVMETLSVSIRLLNDRRDTFTRVATTAGRSNDTPDEVTDSSPLATDQIEQIVAHFEAHPNPVSFENEDQLWAEALRRWHPNIFPHGGERLVVPLVRQGELIGLITLGDRVNAKAYSTQDFDMLTCIADHVTACLLNLQLGQRLVHSRELEAFQTMATFFVHDLKNSASTLNLMLKNLPVHFDDPAFRQDALRGIDKTVKRINRLIGRLSQIRHELTLQRTKVSLVEVIESCLQGLESNPGFSIETEWTSLPPLSVDREQMAKVFTNLILNSMEACERGGTLVISNGRDKNSQFVSFEDNGCGMSEDFMQNSLFRPFHTTKARGLGIGMFQSRMIVEKHGGRIAVTSKADAGTTFQIYLPERED